MLMPSTTPENRERSVNGATQTRQKDNKIPDDQTRRNITAILMNADSIH